MSEPITNLTVQQLAQRAPEVLGESTASFLRWLARLAPAGGSSLTLSSNATLVDVILATLDIPGGPARRVYLQYCIIAAGLHGGVTARDIRRYARLALGNDAGGYLSRLELALREAGRSHRANQATLDLVLETTLGLPLGVDRHRYVGQTLVVAEFVANRPPTPPTPLLPRPRQG